MSLQFVTNDAEDIIYAHIVTHDNLAKAYPDKPPKTLCYLHFRFFHVGIAPTSSEIEKIFEKASFNHDVVVYFCQDGDIIFEWNVNFDETKATIKKAILSHYRSHILEYMPFNDFYDEINEIEYLDKLKTECVIKLKKSTKKKRELLNYFSNETLITTLKKTVLITQAQRFFRKEPQILIVEDQVFSQKMMTSILKDYTCHVAAGSGEALLQYIEKSPDIIFLDIELPDLSGHHFAELINKIDEKAYIIIVSSNQTTKDVIKARSNNAQGYIIKPLQKSKILDAIEKFYLDRSWKGNRV